MAVGYNAAQAIMVGLLPIVATYLIGSVGPVAPGFVITGIAVLCFVGLVCIAPPMNQINQIKDVVADDGEHNITQAKEMALFDSFTKQNYT